MGIIFILCALACTKVTLQGIFAKNKIKTFTDGIFFNGLIFFFSTFVFVSGSKIISWEILIHGIALGIMTVLFQLFYIKAMSCGNVSITALIVNLSMMLPILVSCIFFGEKITLLRLCGIFLTILALIVNVRKSKLLSDFKKWIFYSFLASFLCGTISVFQLLFGKTKWSDQTSSYMFSCYATAFLFSFILFLILKKKPPLSFPLRPSIFGAAGAVGAILGLYQFFNVRAIATIDATLLFPAYNGGTLILATLSGIFILKDRLTKRQLFSVLIGIFAIILMNL